MDIDYRRFAIAAIGLMFFGFGVEYNVTSPGHLDILLIFIGTMLVLSTTWRKKKTLDHYRGRV